MKEVNSIKVGYSQHSIDITNIFSRFLFSNLKQLCVFINNIQVYNCLYDEVSILMLVVFEPSYKNE